MDVNSRQLPLEQQVTRAVGIFISIRWVPPLAIILGVLALKFLLGLNLSICALLCIAFWIALYNLGFAIYHRLADLKTIPRLLRFAMVQMVFDIFSMAALVHHTGGVLSPLVWLFTIHLVIACIFFKRRRVVMIMIAVWLAYLALFAGERLGWIPWRNIYPPTLEMLRTSNVFLLFVVGATAIVWGQVIWLVTMITERVMAAEREDRQLQEELSKTLDGLDKLEKERQLYRRTMTHELRSPITATQSMIKLVLSRTIGPMTDKQKTMLDRSVARLDQILNMLQDLLVLEPEHRKEEDVRPVDLKPLLADITRVVFPQIEEHNLTIDVQVAADQRVFGHPEEIKYILSNLFSNAIKYNKDGGAVRVLAQDRGDRVEISFIDTGIGIAEQDLDKLFNEFYRTPNAKAHYQDGTGLGLAIVKRLLEKNNGTVSISSQLDRGTQVDISLPRAPAER